MDINTELEKIAHVYGDVCIRRKKQRRKRRKVLVIELLFDYARNSTLHGLRYIVDHALSILERLFWLITVIASIMLCSFYIYNVVQKWRTSPVIVTVNGRLSSVGSVPFPAVTICPQMKVNPYNYNYTKNLEMFKKNESLQDGEEFIQFLHVDTMCETQDIYIKNIYKNMTDASMVEDLKKAAPSINDIFYWCYWAWQNKTIRNDCSDMFSRVITEDGVCYTANSLAATDIFEESIQREFEYTESNKTFSGWSIEEGYNYSSKKVYPKRGRVYGSRPDLTVMLRNTPDEIDKSCNQIYSGYKIYLHHPADLPQTSLYYYAALPNQLSSIAISFHELNSDAGLKNYDSKTRQCFFQKDRKLRYFKIYTQKNCQAECLSNITRKQCGCVGFNMPYHNSSEICFPYTKSRCMNNAKDTMSFMERRIDLGLEKEGCNCLPACNTVEYDAEILKTKFNYAKYMKYLMRQWGFNESKLHSTYSRINLFYKKPHFVTMQRRELFGVTDLLANIGGLLGVFLGFSFLSLIEIIYFLTVRVGFILKRDLDEEKTNEKSN